MGPKKQGFWPRINCTQMKLPNFENWSNGELSNIGHHFRKKSYLKIDVIKKCAPPFIFFNEEKKRFLT